MTIELHEIKAFIRHFFQASRKGHGVHSPFAYQLCEEVFYNTYPFNDFEKLNEVRLELMNDDTVLDIEDLGAGSKQLNKSARRVSEIVKSGISTKKQSEILYRLINYLKPQTIIELGTSVGLNTLYLSKASHSSTVFTIEGSRSLHHFAQALSKRQNISNCNFILGNFDQEFQKTLETCKQVGLVYIDGNHTYEATLRYFDLALKYCTEDSILIFDDIYWSKGMTEAWQSIIRHESVTLSIDCFKMGMIFFRKENKEPVHLKFYI